MFSFAARNLGRERVRLAISVGGVAFAVLLIVLLRGLYVAYENKVGDYFDRIPAQLWVVQSGTADFFHSYSIVADDQRGRVADVPGVASVHPYPARQIGFDLRGEQTLLSVVGFDPADPADPVAGPARLVTGSQQVGEQGIVVDTARSAPSCLDLRWSGGQHERPAIDDAVGALSRPLMNRECEVDHGPLGVGIEIMIYIADRYRPPALKAAVGVSGRPNVVRHSDFVLVIGGGHGTLDEVDVAISMGKRIIPFAASGGAAQRAFERVRSDVSLRTWMSDGIFGALGSCTTAEEHTRLVAQIFSNPGSLTSE